MDTVAPECFLSGSLLGRWALWELCAHSDPTLSPSAAISMSTMGRRLMGWGFESLQAQYCLPRVPWDNCAVLSLPQRIKAEKAEITRFFQKPKTPQAPKVSTTSALGTADSACFCVCECVGQVLVSSVALHLIFKIYFISNCEFVPIHHFLRPFLRACHLLIV